MDKASEINFLFEKQKYELTESMKYASFIQKALLPGDQLFNRCFSEYFLLYMPCDIVSGDFYWVTKKGNKLFLAVADCTGHGVPGAFLSILGISLLNQVREKCDSYTASSILNYLREFIMKALQQKGEISEHKDGIDMALCIINLEDDTINYSGAFIPLYIIRNSSQLIEIPADKMPIGVAAEEEESFRDHTVKIEEGDAIYLFTDGYVDQFGGKDGKKFKFRPFRKLLLEINGLDMETQKKHLEKRHNEWRGQLPQLDDITIFGFRYHK